MTKLSERVGILEKKVKNIEDRMPEQDKQDKFPNIRCENCGYQWFTKSTMQAVSCPNCGNKTINPNIREEFKPEDPFKGERYKDYDDLEAKKEIFHKGGVKCSNCKKELKKIEQGFYGFNRLLCKKCYKELELSNQKAVWKMVKTL